MARPKNNDGIRARTRSRDGIQLVHFEEYSGHWIVSPEYERKRAWARRNRDRLVGHKNDLTLKEYCKGFFAKDGLWDRRQKDKGRFHGDMNLSIRQACLDNYFTEEFGHLYPQSIDRPEFRREFDNWLLGLTSVKKKGCRLSRATKNRIVYTVNDFIKELVDLRKMSINPLIGLDKYSKEPENPRGVIDRNSLALMFPGHHEDLIKVWGSPMWACIMLLFYDTGVRPGEARVLTWADIDVEKRFVPFRKGIEAGTTDVVKGSTKTGAVKAGFLNMRSIQEFDIWRSVSRWNRDNDFVFTKNGDKPVTTEGVIKAFRTGLVRIEKANPGWKADPRWSPYWIRHSFGTYQMENLSEDEIASLMGNGVAILKKHYQHPDNETLYRSTKGIRNKLDKARKSS